MKGTNGRHPLCSVDCPFLALRHDTYLSRLAGRNDDEQGGLTVATEFSPRCVVSLIMIITQLGPAIGISATIGFLIIIIGLGRECELQSFKKRHAA